ncbi:MAG: sulfotransferase [Deltaproteobacteria bacterium]|nr:MAG: sulfotransferase [Deltaproteobacteria bacterium]
MTANGEVPASFRESEAALHEAAVEAVGCDDFGDPSYLDGLRVLLDAYDREAKLTPVGRQLTYRGIRNILVARLRVQQQLRAHPEALAAEIDRPVFICGLVRTGSTALHHLLGRDPDILVLPYWLACHPQPRPPRAEWDAHPDFRASVAELDGMYAADPSLKAIHFMEADGPEECRHFLAQNFTDDGFEVNTSIPSYRRWYASRFLRDTYLRHRDLLKLVGSTCPGRRWVLKYPVHMRNLRALLEVYPDACIVQTHRDPATVLSSYVSLIASFRSLFEDAIDRAAIARDQLELWAAGAEDAIAVRREHDAARFFDLHFRDTVADPIACVKRIYARFDLRLSEAGERALQRWHADNPPGKHGRHAYSMDDVGISRAEILDRFETYMDHFGIEPE